MSYPREVADFILNTKGEAFLKTFDEVQYIAVVEDKKKPNHYLFEKGIKVKGAFFKETINEIPFICNFDKDSLDEINSLSTNQKFNQEQKINTDQKRVERIRPQNLGKHLIRPLISGCSIKGNLNLRNSGTLGAFLKLKNTEDRIFIISNYHVLSPKESIFFNITYQPKNTYRNHKNAVAEFFLGSYPNPNESSINSVDVGFTALLKKDMPYVKGFLHSDILSEREEPYLKGIEEPKDGMEVYIYGMQTGKSKKTLIRSTNAMVKVDSAYNNHKKLIFKNQILTKAISQPGDSGSVLINNKTKKVVGLVHAGDKKYCTISNNIKHIFDRIYYVNGKSTKIEFESFLT